MGLVIRKFKKLFLKGTKSMGDWLGYLQGDSDFLHQGGWAGPPQQVQAPCEVAGKPHVSQRLVGVKAAACTHVLSCRDPGRCAAASGSEPFPVIFP